MSLADVAAAGRIRGFWPLNEAGGAARESFRGLNGADATGVGSAPGHIYPLSRSFVAANSDHFVVPSSVWLNMPSSGVMTLCGWAYQNSLAATMALFARWGLPNSIVYNAQFLNGTPLYRLLIGNALGDNTGAICPDADVIVGTGAWYFIRAEVDENLPRTRIQVNEVLGYFSVTNPGWSLVDSGDLWIGSDEATGNDFDGRLQAWALIEGTLTGPEITEIYNGGAGFDLGLYAPNAAQNTGYNYYYPFHRRDSWAA